MRGLLAVLAMGRPPRPASEAALVREIAASWGGSARARATRAARLVATEAVAELDTDPDDATDRLIAATRSAFAPTPVRRLATCPTADIASLIVAARTVRFQARGGRQLSSAAWQRETAQIVGDVSAILAERFRRHLRR